MAAPDDDLQGDDALHPAVLGLEDLAHAAFAELFQDRILAEREILDLALQDAARLVRVSLPARTISVARALGLAGRLAAGRLPRNCRLSSSVKTLLAAAQA